MAKRCDKSLLSHQLASQLHHNLHHRTALIRGIQKPTVQTRVAEPSSDAAPAPAAAKKTWSPRVKREVTVDLATVNNGDEFEGVVVSTSSSRSWLLAAVADLRSISQTNISTFGAFVNFGAAKEGLVHISQLSVRFIL